MKVVIVGGFLGSGKTTLLWAAARELMAMGKRVGLITNDQAPDLVDTTLLVQQGLDVREIAGSCFCCNFEWLLRSIDELEEVVRADVLFAEPVGSCTDLCATLLRPLKRRLKQEVTLAPLSVLVDPHRTGSVLGEGEDPGMHPSAAYIFRKQLEEADRILVNKADLLADGGFPSLAQRLSRSYPGIPVRRISSRTGEGVASWLEDIFADPRAGERLLDIDYGTYAEGEAVLGWLNCEVRLAAAGGDLPRGEGICRTLMEDLRDAFRLRQAAVGHVKLVLLAGGGHVAANLVRADGDVEIRGGPMAPGPEARMILNARVEIPPKQLERIVLEQLDRLADGGIGVRVQSLRSLSPAAPVPTYRVPGIPEP